MSKARRQGAEFWEEVVPRSSANAPPVKPQAWNPRSTSAFEMRIQYATTQDLLNAWDCDLWHLSQSPVNVDLKPLTAEELEGLVTKFPDLMPHVYVRPDAVLFRTASSKGNLVEALRADLVSPGQVTICRHVRTPEVAELSGDVSGTADVMAFNTLRITALHQTLVRSRPMRGSSPRPQRSGGTRDPKNQQHRSVS